MGVTFIVFSNAKKEIFRYVSEIKTEMWKVNKSAFGLLWIAQVNLFKFILISNDLREKINKMFVEKENQNLIIYNDESSTNYEYYEATRSIWNKFFYVDFV